MAVKLGSNEFLAAQRLQAMFTELEDIILEMNSLPGPDARALLEAARTAYVAIETGLDDVAYYE